MFIHKAERLSLLFIIPFSAEDDFPRESVSLPVWISLLLNIYIAKSN